MGWLLSIEVKHIDPYQVLQIPRAASAADIKAAYRQLVKQHHPDAGGDPKRIVAINVAYEILGDPAARKAYDGTVAPGVPFDRDATTPPRSRQHAWRTGGAGVAQQEQLLLWLRLVFDPVCRQMGKVINPFHSQLRALAANPYDDQLMEAFCCYIKASQRRLDVMDVAYRSCSAPRLAKGMSIGLFQCFNQLREAIDQLDLYTKGYVDDCLRDGQEMLRQAKRMRMNLQQERRQIGL